MEKTKCSTNSLLRGLIPKKTCKRTIFSVSSSLFPHHECTGLSLHVWDCPWLAWFTEEFLDLFFWSIFVILNKGTRQGRKSDGTLQYPGWSKYWPVWASYFVKSAWKKLCWL